jgi:hypothetical protein
MFCVLLFNFVKYVLLLLCLCIVIVMYVGWDCSVGIATRYGVDGRGSYPSGVEIFCIRRERSWGPPSLLYNGYRVFPGGKAAGAWR